MPEPATLVAAMLLATQPISDVAPLCPEASEPQQVLVFIECVAYVVGDLDQPLDQAIASCRRAIAKQFCET